MSPHVQSAANVSTGTNYFKIKITAEPANVEMCRETVRYSCIMWRLEDLFEDARLIASELVTNAVNAAGGTEIEFEVRRTPATLMIYVWDKIDKFPEIRTYDLDDLKENGRGWFIVKAYSHRSGWFEDEKRGGKVVWAQLMAK